MGQERGPISHLVNLRETRKDVGLLLFQFLLPWRGINAGLQGVRIS